MKENKSKFPKSLSEIKLFPCPPAADDFCKQVSHKSDDMWSYRSKATQSLWLSSCCSSHGCRSHLSSFIQAARCRSEKQSLCLQLHHVASIFDSDCFICHCQCNPPKQKTNPSARLGNEGHINMCCANSCTGRGEATLQGGGVAPPSRSTVTRLEGASRWKSKTQPDHRGCEGRVGSPLWTTWRQGKLGRRSPGTCFYQARTSCCQGLVPHGPAL